ncbi:MAG: hypothetical protein KKG59_03345, partial [Nanoarchaeota archaeon]|nr:hypothetical protein [Nanoarchaeota archaeon]
MLDGALSFVKEINLAPIIGLGIALVCLAWLSRGNIQNAMEKHREKTSKKDKDITRYADKNKKTRFRDMLKALHSYNTRQAKRHAQTVAKGVGAGLGILQARFKELKDAKKSKDKISIREAESGIAGAESTINLEESASETEDMERLTTILEEKNLDCIAAITIIIDSIEEYVAIATTDDQMQEREEEFIDQLVAAIEKEASQNVIDSHMHDMLTKFFHNLRDHVRAETESENGRQKQLETLLANLRKALVEIGKVLADAKKVDGVFRKHESKLKKDFRTSYEKLRKGLQDKEIELREAKAMGSDKTGRKNLDTERQIDRDQLKAAQKVDQSVSESLKLIERMNADSDMTIAQVLKYQKKAMGFETKLEDATQRLAKRRIRLQNAAKMFELEPPTNPHAFALLVAEKMKHYLSVLKYQNALAGSFNQALRGFVSNIYEIARLAMVFQNYERSIEEAEESLNQGIVVMNKVLETVWSDESRVAEDVDGYLTELNTIIEGKEKIDDYIKTVLKETTAHISGANLALAKLGEEDTKVINVLTASSARLGQLVAVGVQRKAATSNMTMGEINAFTKKMEKANKDTAKEMKNVRKDTGFKMAGKK